MSRTRRREKFDPKKGKFDPLAAFFNDFPPPPPGQPQNPIAFLINVDAAGFVARNANRDSATQRWDRMKGDPSIEPSLSILGSCSDFDVNFDVMRLFLSILIGYWGDKDELKNLDDATGKPYFRSRITADDIARTRRMEMSEGPTQYEKFSYEIKDADDAKNMESVRGLLVTRYADKENVDIDALVEKIKSTLLSHLKMGVACGLYNGKEAIIDIMVADARRPTVSMQCAAPPWF